MRKTQDLSRVGYRTLMTRLDPSLIEFIQEESHRQSKSMALLLSEVIRDYQKKIEKKLSSS